MDAGRLAGRSAVVTGAASGLGEAIAVAFGREGARVVVADVDEERGCDVAAAIEASGGTAIFTRTDVRRLEDVEGAVQAARSSWGSIDVMVNNAGIHSKRDTLLELDTELWDEMIAVHLRGVFFGMKCAVPSMIDQGGGVILSTASVAALPGFIGGLSYGAAKAGIVKLTITVAARHAHQGIRANAILPGMIQTPLADKLMGAQDADEREQLFAAFQPTPRGGRPEDIAGAAVWLASDEASFVTGQSIVVDGGLVASGWGRGTTTAGVLRDEAR